MYGQCGCVVLPETRVLQRTKPATYWRLLTSCCSGQQVYVQQIVTPMDLAHNSIHPVTIPADVKPTAELQSSLAQDLQSATSSEVPALCYSCSPHLTHVYGFTPLLNRYCGHSAGTDADIHNSAGHRYYNLVYRRSFSSPQALQLPLQPASGAH